MNELATFSAIKNSSYVLAYIATINFLGFNPESVGIFTTLMVVDVVTGIVRACSQEGCHTVKSSVGTRGILAKILLLAGLFSIGLAGRGIGFDMSGSMQGMINVLMLSELYSILGNVHSAITGKKKNEFDAVAFILGQIKALLTRFVKP